MKITIQQIYMELERRIAPEVPESNIPVTLWREIRRVQMISDGAEVKEDNILYLLERRKSAAPSAVQSAASSAVQSAAPSAVQSAAPSAVQSAASSAGQPAAPSAVQSAASSAGQPTAPPAGQPTALSAVQPAVSSADLPAASFTEVPATLLLTEGYYIRTPGITDPSALMNLLQEVLAFLWQVEDHLREIAVTGQDYDELIHAAEDELGLSMLLVDRNLHYLAETDNYRLLNYDWMGDSEDMTIEWVNILEQDEAFMRAIEHPGVFRYSLQNDIALVSYCFNVRVNGQYEARLLLQRDDREDFHGGLEWADCIGRLVQMIFIRNYDQMSQTSDAFRFYALIQDLAEERPVNPEELQMTLRRAGWGADCRYQVYMFRQQVPENETVNRRYYQTALQRLLGECVVFETGGELCVVRNLTRTPAIYRDVRQDLAVFLRENLFYVGISREFSDILQLKYYGREALGALETGLAVGGTSWSYYYSELILPNILRLAREQLPAAELEHPALQVLRDYDAREGTELVETVFEFMRQQYNVTHTAKALFVHRTTLLFRLERIRTLTGLDWSRMEDRVLLGLSCIAADAE